MSGFVQVAFNKTLAAPEGGDGFPGRGVEQLGDLLEGAGHLETATATSEGSLDGHGQAVLFRETHHFCGIGDGVRGSRHLWGAHFLGDVAGLDLVSQALDGLGWGTYPLQARVHDGSGEAGVLSQKTVARVHSGGTGATRHVKDLLHVQIGVRGGCPAQGEGLVREPHEQRIRIGVGIHSNRGDARVVRGPDHPYCDLPTVGDQNLRDDLVVHLLPPPVEPLWRILLATMNLCPSTVTRRDFRTRA